MERRGKDIPEGNVFCGNYTVFRVLLTSLNLFLQKRFKPHIQFALAHKWLQPLPDHMLTCFCSSCLCEMQTLQKKGKYAYHSEYQWHNWARQWNGAVNTTYIKYWMLNISNNCIVVWVLVITLMFQHCTCVRAPDICIVQHKQLVLMS